VSVTEIFIDAAILLMIDVCAFAAFLIIFVVSFCCFLNLCYFKYMLILCITAFHITPAVAQVIVVAIYYAARFNYCYWKR